MRTLARIKLSPGELGTDETIGIMAAVAHDAAANSERVQAIARRIAADNDSEWLRLRDLYTFLRDRVTFAPDRPGVEEIRLPESMLAAIEKDGTIAADCDDRATLGVAIVRALGLPAYFVVMKRDHSRAWHHVYYGAGLSVLPNQVIPFDPQANTPPGEWTKDAARKIYYA